ncbi:hypothetical protein Tco_0905540, partial [Tanacetum coccineum]
NGYRWQSQGPRNHGGALAQTRSERVLEKPNEPPLPEGHTSRSGEGSMEHTFELLDIVLDLEKEKDAQAIEILKLKQRVKKLERKRKSSISYPRRRIYRQVESFDDDLDEEDASKQERESDKTKLMMLNRRLEVNYESEMAFELLRLQNHNFRSRKVFGYILLMIKMLILKKLDD